MSFVVTIRCDAFDCFRTLRTEELEEIANELRWHNWKDDPDAIGLHYCPECFKLIQQAQTEEECRGE